MSIEFSEGIYFGEKVDSETIDELWDKAPDTMEKYNDYITYLNAWTGDGCFVGYPVKIFSEEESYVVKCNESYLMPAKTVESFGTFMAELNKLGYPIHPDYHFVKRVY